MKSPISLADFYEKYWLIDTPDGPKKPVLKQWQRELMDQFDKGQVTYPMEYTHKSYIQVCE